MRKSYLITLLVVSTLLFLPHTSASDSRRILPLRATLDVETRITMQEAGLGGDITERSGWFSYLELLDHHNAKSIAGNFYIYENDIDSTKNYDLVAFYILTFRYIIKDGIRIGREWVQVGYFQDGVDGYCLYSACESVSRWVEVKKYVLPETQHSVEIRESTNGTFESLIDGKVWQSFKFSEGASDKRYFSAEGFSSEVSNTLKGHFWNLEYDSYAWDSIRPYQDEPFYTRLDSTDAFYSTLMGDITLDYYVGCEEVGLLNYHYYDPPWFVGAGGYSAKVDFTHDGLIDLFDVMKVYCNWHKSW